MSSCGLKRPKRAQQVKMMKTDQMGVGEGRGRLSAIFHLSRRAEEQAVTKAARLSPTSSKDLLMVL